MEKPKLITWRKTALKQLGEILDFYQNEYSIQASENLVNAIEATIEKVYNHPTIQLADLREKWRVFAP